jgi:hypothetical protein
MADPVEFRIGDVGSVLEVLVTELDDDTGLPVLVDVSGVATKEITIKKPSGEVVTFAATFTSDGTDGLIRYVWAAGDLDELSRGRQWLGSPHVAWAGGVDVHGEAFGFLVKNIFEA